MIMSRWKVLSKEGKLTVLCNTHPPNPMPVSYYNRTAERYRITLDITVQDDFNPHQIDWRKVLDLQDNECVESVTEDLSNPVSW